MAQWGRNDASVNATSSTTKETSNGAPIGTYALAKGGLTSMDANSHFGNTSAGSRANVDVNMYGNVTIGAFVANMAIGVFAVNTSQANGTASGGNLAIATVSFGGSGYQANAAVTLTVTNGGTSGVVNAHANTSTNAGRIDALNISTAGSGYITAPTVAIAAPAAITLNANNSTFEPTGANSAFSANTNGISSNTFIAISTANTVFPTQGQKVIYRTPAGNTVVAPLANNAYYYIAFSNSTVVSLATTQALALANTPIANLNPQTAALTGELANTYDVFLLTSANSYWQVGDALTYQVPTSNTPVSPLTGNTTYYVSFANTTAMAISATSGGANISFAPSTSSTETHTIQGQTATGYLDTNSTYPQVSHAGWVVRREGTGGRAGRVHFETLVAMSSIGVSGTSSTGVTGAANPTSNATNAAVV